MLSELFFLPFSPFISVQINLCKLTHLSINYFNVLSKTLSSVELLSLDKSTDRWHQVEYVCNLFVRAAIKNTLQD